MTSIRGFAQAISPIFISPKLPADASEASLRSPFPCRIGLVEALPRSDNHTSGSRFISRHSANAWTAIASSPDSDPAPRPISPLCARNSSPHTQVFAQPCRSVCNPEPAPRQALNIVAPDCRSQPQPQCQLLQNLSLRSRSGTGAALWCGRVSAWPGDTGKVSFGHWRVLPGAACMRSCPSGRNLITPTTATNPKPGSSLFPMEGLLGLPEGSRAQRCPGSGFLPVSRFSAIEDGIRISLGDGRMELGRGIPNGEYRSPFLDPVVRDAAIAAGFKETASGKNGHQRAARSCR